MRVFAVLAGLLSGFLFGLATPLSKMILGHLNAFLLAGLLYLGAAAAFLPFVLRNWRSEYLAVRRSARKRYLPGIIIFGGFLGPLFLMAGLRSADAASVSVWLNMELVATALLGVVLFKDHLDRYGVFGVVLTVIAGIIVTVQEQGSGLVSGLFVVMACVSWGIDNHLTALIDGVSPQTVTFIKGVFGGAVNLAVGLVIGGTGFEVGIIPLTLVIGMFSYGVSIVLYVTSAQNLGATRSQILFSTAPFWGVAASCFLLNEAITLNLLTASIFLAAGIAFTAIASHRHEHVHQNVTHIHLHSHDDGHHDHEHPGIADDPAMHSHMHEHKGITHLHGHFPDLHHRHEH